ncbi:hypothetical protein A5893_03055 [Pedobacter psychrophilus]|uniref:Helix-turn-helix domain-containing protein n=1 Tax=Pedobacter psychrophilus TaxID=1826909 RepID=A0A179DMH8_9SPHI|nr:DNA-binding protein [Pedobacter psychrophilus]OAQ42108.1 hypothetical protein A5893_03055 [Pedobacter psychrophilus]
METIVNHSNAPLYLGKILDEIRELRNEIAQIPAVKTASLPKYVNINEGAKIVSKSPNALRVQISLGNLKSIKKGSRHYFEREYLENWISGKLDNDKFFDKKKGVTKP